MANKKQAMIDARMRAVKEKLAGPTPDYAINKGVKDWDCVFFWAAERGDVTGMKKAMKKGANINWVSSLERVEVDIHVQHILFLSYLIYTIAFFFVSFSSFYTN
jgi:hypothetical protein